MKESDSIINIKKSIGELETIILEIEQRFLEENIKDDILTKLREALSAQKKLYEIVFKTETKRQSRIKAKSKLTKNSPPFPPKSKPKIKKPK